MTGKGKFSGFRSSGLVLLAALICLAIMIPTPALAKKKKKHKKQEEAPAPVHRSVISKLEVSKIVWPVPPAIARVKYLTFFAGQKLPDFNAKPKKQHVGWMKRLSGDVPQKAGRPSLQGHFFLGEPHGIGFDSKGNIYVADTKVGAIFIFNPETHDTQMIKNGQGARFVMIEGLALDDSDRLFVADSGAGRVLVFGPNHKGQAVITQGLVEPYGLAVDNENRFLYVSDLAKDQVMVYDADTFRLLRKIGTAGKHHTLTDPGDFAKPAGLAVDKDGNLYVCDLLNFRIEEFDANGKFIRAFGKHGDGPGYFSMPKGVAVDSDGHVWVSDAMTNRVQIFSRQGQFLLYVGNATGILPGMFSGLQDIAIDTKHHRMATTEVFPGRVQLFQYVTEAEARAEYNKRLAAAKAEHKGARPAAKPVAVAWPWH